MKHQETLLTIISYLLMIIVLVLLVFCYQLHIAGDQKMVVMLSSIVLICFGGVLTAETKLKWVEKKNKE
ncbi:MAG: hypothetical protein KAH01_01875 [Caldisericia bacterium]|nr:hypothetical protein [Caldisericia bacterium]